MLGQRASTPAPGYHGNMRRILVFLGEEVHVATAQQLQNAATQTAANGSDDTVLLLKSK